MAGTGVGDAQAMDQIVHPFIGTFGNDPRGKGDEGTYPSGQGRRLGL